MTAGTFDITATTSGTAQTAYSKTADGPANRVFVYNNSDTATIYVNVNSLHKSGEYFPLRPKVGVSFEKAYAGGIAEVKVYATAATGLDMAVTGRD